MAFREVDLTEEERAAMQGAYFKFNAIGDRLMGRFLSTRPSTGTYAKPGQLDYVFRHKNAETGAIEDVTLTPPADLVAKLKKAGLKPGWKVSITYASDLDVGKESPMKIFKLLVDDSPAAAPAPAAPAPKPAPKPAPADDIDF